MLLPSIYYLEVLELLVYSFLVFCTTLNRKKKIPKKLWEHTVIIFSKSEYK